MEARLDTVREALRSVVDPELHLNIVDLGLIYSIKESAPGKVHITMTLTTPGCPVGSAILQAVERVVEQLPGIEEVDVELTFEPRWTPEFITDEGRRFLNML